ncbi:hypothetical protein ES707_20967 [subsurface metagenome]
MNKTLLAIGDIGDWDSYAKFHKKRRLLKEHEFGFVAADYDAVLNDDLPAITSKTIVILLFFPFVYWDRHIEPRSYAGVYGNRRFYAKWKKFWRVVAGKLRRHYKGKKIHFVNSPENIPPERDKQLTKEILAAAHVPTPRSYRTTSTRTILRLLRQGKPLFIKVRYGSMGKGITYLEEQKWLTNFCFRGGRILNRHSDYGWRFRNVTGNERFLRQLLKEDVVIEEAVPRWLIRGVHFDLRALVFFGRILYMIPRSNVGQNVTTNVSQGARPWTMSFLEGISEELIGKARTTAVRATRALGLNFAGVDIMLDPHRQAPIVIELNAFPGFPKVRTFNLAKSLITEIGNRRWK